MPISFQNPTDLRLPRPLKRPEVQLSSLCALFQAVILMCMDSLPARILGAIALLGLLTALVFIGKRKE